MQRASGINVRKAHGSCTDSDSAKDDRIFAKNGDFPYVRLDMMGWDEQPGGCRAMSAVTDAGSPEKAAADVPGWRT